MIFDIVKKSLAASRVLIPVEELLGDSRGSRMPEIEPSLLNAVVAERIVSACPTAALAIERCASTQVLALDYGECIGCGRCYKPSEGAMVPARNMPACGGTRNGLVRRWDVQGGTEQIGDGPDPDLTASQIRSVLGRALNIRQVDGGSCNGCEAEITALANPYYDLERFGIHFVASPKHADMLLVTGPVTRNMAEAVKLTYAATPSPKLVVAVGACGIGGGIFTGSYAVVGGVDSVIPVDGYIPGCPPTPAMLLTGILRVLRTRTPAGA
jgi:Ni,Fe-hydrogenase III small subunit/NAD-dependent dihydropyrimidine dehydrogenase PreA subunit